VAAFTGLNSSTRFTTDLLAEGWCVDDDDDVDGDHINVVVEDDDGILPPRRRGEE